MVRVSLGYKMERRVFKKYILVTRRTWPWYSGCGVLPWWRGAPCEELVVSVHPDCVVHGKGLRERKPGWVWMLLDGLFSAVMDVHEGNS